MAENQDFRYAPIGVFDSGVGGLTVAREIMRQIPKERIIYFGDTARVPYGSKSQVDETFAVVLILPVGIDKFHYFHRCCLSLQPETRLHLSLSGGFRSCSQSYLLFHTYAHAGISLSVHALTAVLLLPPHPAKLVWYPLW